MSLRAAVAAVSAACTLLPVPVQAQPGVQAVEQLLIPFSQEEWKTWKVGSQAKRPNLTMVEYIPKDQDIGNWDRMLTVQIFHNLRIPLSRLMGQMKASFEAKQPCEHSKYRAFGSKKVNGYDTSLHWLICTKSKQNGKGEFALILGVQGRDALYLVQRAWRGAAYGADAVPLSQVEFKSWLTFMNKIQVCDPRVSKQACPTGLRRNP